jgi:hypothetical protein
MIICSDWQAILKCSIIFRYIKDDGSRGVTVAVGVIESTVAVVGQSSNCRVVNGEACGVS